MRTIRVLWHRIAHRFDWCRCRALWGQIDTPEFREKFRKAMADYAEGRYYTLVPTPGARHDWVPNPDWPKDGERP